MAREKRLQEHHHFKAGSLNALVGILASLLYGSEFSPIS
jgi:hypothetical protein